MPYEVDIGDGADALGQNQLTDALDGTYWVSGWDATLGTGDLEVDISSGEGAINGGDVSTGSTQTVDFTGDPDATDPRKAVISVDDTGTVQKTLGTAVPAAPADEVRFRTYDPAPPTNAPGVVVAEVWLAAGETSLTSDDVRDRRVTNDASINATPNTPDWVEDSNSAFTESSSQSIDVTVDSGFDLYKLFVKATGDAVDPDIFMRVNDVTTDIYSYWSLNSEENKDQDRVSVGRLEDSNVFIEVSLYIHDEQISYAVEPSITTNLIGNGGNASKGFVEDSPLSSIEFFSSTETANWTVEVYHRNVS